MSQEKVDRYKQEKANRQQIIKKQKRDRMLGILLALVIVIGLLVWFGVAVFRNVSASRAASAPAQMTELDLTEVDSYLQELSEMTDGAE